MSTKPIKVIGIKTKSGYYISTNVKNISYHTNTLFNYIINGENPTKTFDNSWAFVKDIPKTIERKVNRPNINHRFELVEDAPGKDELPKVMPREEVMEEYDGTCKWKDEFKHLQSLYIQKSDAQDPILEKIDFEFELLMEINDDLEKVDLNYDIQRTSWSHEGKAKVNPSNIQYQIIDKIIFPNVILQKRPCKLSSELSYKIVREYIKQNINYNVAEITSDYNFCLTVKKRVVLKAPDVLKKEVLTPTGRSYKHKKHRDVFVKDRLIEVFEMTHSGDNYKGYTVLPGFEGKDYKGLKQNIDKYLKDLMVIINEPLADCPHCNGMGVVENG